MIQFVDSGNQRRFEHDGFVIVSLLDDADVSRVRDCYESVSGQCVPPSGASVFSTCDSGNPKLIRQIDSSLREIVVPALAKVLTSYDYLLSSFLAKAPGNANETVFHHDPTMVDRYDVRAVSAGLWCPLHAVNRENGCLRVIRGSHRLGDILAVTPVFPTIFRDFENRLPKFAEALELPPGQAVIFDNKLIHGAFPNRTQQRRVALVTALKSPDSEWCYYFRPGQGDSPVQKYRMDYDTYTCHETGKPPQGTLMEVFDHRFEQLTYHQFLRFMWTNSPLVSLKSLIR